MKISSAAVLLVTSLAGCAATVATSTDVLGPDRSHAVLGATSVDAARTVTQLLAARGYMLVDQQADGAGLALRFVGNREAVVRGARGASASTQFGSAFQVAVQPSTRGALVSIIGRPTVDGVVVCTTDDQVRCSHRWVDAAFANNVDGVAEASVVNGVFAELALDGAVVRAPVTAAK